MTTQITIVGVGALGSHLVQLLRSEDAQLHIVDFDRVEARNLGSQFHGLPQKGKLKVDSLKQTCLFLWGQKFQTSSAKLTKDNAQQLLGKANLVVDCLDNGDGRRVIQGFVRDRNIPCIHGALAADGSFGRVCWDASFVIDDESSAGQPTCEDGEFLPFIALTAAYLAQAIQEYLRRGVKVGYQVSPGATFRV